MEINSVSRDSQGRLSGLSFRVPDEIFGSRSFELSWFEPQADVREIQVLEQGKIALSARCRQLKKDELKLTAPPMATSEGWQRASKVSPEATTKL